MLYLVHLYSIHSTFSFLFITALEKCLMNCFTIYSLHLHMMCSKGSFDYCSHSFEIYYVWHYSYFHTEFYSVYNNLEHRSRKNCYLYPSNPYLIRLGSIPYYSISLDPIVLDFEIGSFLLF